MELLQTILVTLVTLGLLVTVHEYGHFVIARRCGVKVLRFSVGFGTPLWMWKDAQGTEYAIAAIPLGGYVKMLDEREADVAPEEADRAFNRQSPWARIAIAAAGPLANLLLAVAAYWLVFMGGVTALAPVLGEIEPDSVAARAGLEPGMEVLSVDGEPTPTREAFRLALLDRLGETGAMTLEVSRDGATRRVELPLDRWLIGAEAPDPLGDLGIGLYRPAVEATVEAVVEGGPAAAAGMLAGDRIVAVDGEPIGDWADWVSVVRANPGVSLLTLVERGGSTLPLELVPARKVDVDGAAYGFVGVQVRSPEWPPEMLRTQEYSAVAAVPAAIKKTTDMVGFTLRSIGKMISGLLSPKNLSGPITIAKVAGASAQYGWAVWLGFVALLSVSLAVLNLLPVPVLDGGHIVYALLELISGKPLADKIQLWGNQIGLVLVLSLMAFAIYNDFTRL